MANEPTTTHKKISSADAGPKCCKSMPSNSSELIGHPELIFNTLGSSRLQL